MTHWFKGPFFSAIISSLAVLYGTPVIAENVLVTGGAGFIGSHVVVELLNNGYDVILLDNFARKGSENIPNLISKIVGEGKFKKLKVIKGDLLDQIFTDKVFETNKIDTVIHLAGLKAVGESVEDPLKYYGTNIISTINLLKSMEKNKVKKMVFSSSATVYGEPTQMPIDETFPLQAVNPYGETKLLIEKMLMDMTKSDSVRKQRMLREHSKKIDWSKPQADDWRFVSLRYFNPIGAHKSGLIGDFQEKPNNVMPYILDVIMKKSDKPFTIYGKKYDTSDGTAVRDYVHITDLAKGHVAALNYLKKDDVYAPETLEKSGAYSAFNLGTGQGVSVLGLVNAVEKALKNDFKDAELQGKKLEFKYVIGDARPGDVPVSYANPALAKKNLQWTATLGLDEMVVDSIRFALANPDWFKK